MVTIENFTRVNNDVNGNPRFALHFLNLLTDNEQNGGKSINDMYNEAVRKAKSIGGKRYRGNDFGGCIVFQSYNLDETSKKINKLLIKKL